mgnify:CR=1 FL=1
MTSNNEQWPGTTEKGLEKTLPSQETAPKRNERLDDPYFKFSNNEELKKKYNAGDNWLSFFKYASEEGNTEDIDYALDVINKMFADRDDLRAGLYIAKNDYTKAEEMIEACKDSTLYIGMAYQVKKIEVKNPGSKKRILETVEQLDKKYYKDLVHILERL